jgi:4-hydroxy-2-oxoheptanedioate aldolase
MEEKTVIELARRLREKLSHGCVFGIFSKTSDPAFIEITGYAGFDFVILDLEHGANSVQTIQNLIRAAEIAGVTPVVRVKEDTLSVIEEVLDIGAAGVQIPHVNNAERVKRVLQVAKFAPLGERGVCRFVRAARYSSMDRFQYFREANEALVIIHIEGREGLEGLPGILDTGGVDVVFIGPYDLSQSLGVHGQVEHERVISTIREIVEMCKEKNVAVGTFVESVEWAMKWRLLGIRYIAYSVDVGLFYEKCCEIVGKLSLKACRDEKGGNS